MNTKANELWPFYEWLTPGERLNLVLAACERGDQDDIRDLENTCTKDNIYDFYRYLVQLTCVTSLVVIQMLARTIIVNHILTDLTDESDASPKRQQALMSYLGQEAAIWRGFVAWCRELGQDPRQLLRLAPFAWDKGDPTFSIIHQEIDMIDAWADNPEHLLPDPEQVQQWRDTFASLFRPVRGARR